MNSDLPLHISPLHQFSDASFEYNYCGFWSSAQITEEKCFAGLLIYRRLFVSLVEENHLKTHGSKCVLWVFIWADMASETLIPMFLKQGSDIHFLQQMSGLMWSLIKDECVFLEWRLSFTVALLVITEREVSDTCQNTGQSSGGGHCAILDVPLRAYHQQAQQD